jgi:hypothetical protein
VICAKDNPFAVSRIEALGYIPFSLSWEALMRRLRELDYTAAIVGTHGSGKTTLMKELEKKLQIHGIQTKTIFISNDVDLPWRIIQDKAASVPAGGVLFFDGACHLSRWRWRQLRRQAQRQKISIVVTSHYEGLLPTLVCCQPRPETLAGLVKQLLGDLHTDEQAECVKLFQMHRGNIRDCLRQLYDDVAENKDIWKNLKCIPLERGGSIHKWTNRI